MAKYFFSIREQDKDGFKTVQFFVFSLRTDPTNNGPTCKLEAGGNIVRSTDNGSSFDNVTSPWTGQNKYEVAFGNNTFVVVEHRQRIVRSTDNGSSFVNVTSPGSANNYYGVGFGNNTFVAVGVSGSIIRSTDNGSSFVNVTSPTEIQLREVTFKE